MHAMQAGTLDTFRLFSITHLLVVVVFIALTTVLCIVGRRLARRGAERPLSLALGWAGLAVVLAHQAFWMLPTNFTWSRSLPLHLCDVAGFVAPLALLLPRRWLRVTLYFWGLALSSQGFLTPVITEGPSTLIFWFFFTTHGVIVGYAIYDFVVRGFVPTWRDWRRCVTLTFLYIVVMFVLNLATGWNYAYVGRGSTSQTTAVDFLGPWPWRVPLICALGVLGCALAMAPWEIRKRVRALRGRVE